MSNSNYCFNVFKTSLLLFALATSLFGANTNSPTVSLTPPNVSVSSSVDTGIVDITITVSEYPNKKPIVITYETIDGSASSLGTPTQRDYTSVSGTFTINDNTQQSITISIDINDIAGITEDKEFTFAITSIQHDSPQEHTEGTLSSVITITHDGTPDLGIDFTGVKCGPMNTLENGSIELTNSTTITGSANGSLNTPTFANSETGSCDGGSCSASGAGVSAINFTVSPGVETTNELLISTTTTITDVDASYKFIEVKANTTLQDTILRSSGDFIADGYVLNIIGNVYIHVDGIVELKMSEINFADDYSKLTIVTNNDVVFGSSFSVTPSDNPPSNFQILAKGDITDLASDSTIRALIYADGDVTVGSNSHIYGSITAKNIISGSDANIDSSQNGGCDAGDVGDVSDIDDPEYEQCGLFPSALNTWEDINAAGNGGAGAADEVIYADTIFANGSIGGNVACKESLNANAQECTQGELLMDPPTLPPFISSSLSTANTATSTEVDFEYGYMTTTNDVSLEPGTTYATSSRSLMLIKSLTVASGSTLTFAAGDYYIGELIVNGGIVVRTTGPVRLFIGDNFTLTQNNIDFNYDSGNGQASNMFVFVYGNFEFASQGGGSIQNMTAFVYAQGTFTANHNSNNSSFNGAVTAVGSIYLNNNQTYNYDDSGLDNAGFGNCQSSLSYLSGPFDAWDVTALDSASVPLDRNISTKISNKSFQLSLASLDSTRTMYQTKNGTGSGIGVAIYAQSDRTTAISNEITFDSNTTSHVETSSNFLVSSASRDAIVGFKMCSTYEEDEATGIGTHTLHENTLCLGALVDCNVKTFTGNPKWHVCYATDNLAIRPQNFNLILPATTPKAGQLVDFDFEAQDFTGIPTNDYNESTGNSFNIDINETNAACITGTFSPSINSWSFADGNKTLTTAYSEVGLVNISMYENIGVEFAVVDADDTPDISRYITPFDANITIAPDHFSILATLTDMGSNSTYISSDLNMSSTLNLSITAEALGDTTTQNYNTLCYAKSIDINVSYDTLTFPVPNPLTTIKYLETNTSIESNVSINSNLTLTLPASIFTTDTNGTATPSVLINFDRKSDTVVNPFEFTIADINVTDVNDTTGSISPVNQVATYIYGRTDASRQRFTGDTGTSFIYYESYCYGANCDKSLLPDSTASFSSSDPRWFRNNQHVMATDGNVGSISQKGASSYVTAGTPTAATPANVALTYSGTTYPYKATMENNASSWLIYNKYDATKTENEFEVEFINNAGNWAGKNETNTSTGDNASSKTNRRVMW